MNSILMRADEVAAALSIGRSKAYELMANGTLATVRIGRAVRVPRAALEEWVRARTAAATGSEEQAWVSGNRESSLKSLA